MVSFVLGILSLSWSLHSVVIVAVSDSFRLSPIVFTLYFLVHFFVFSFFSWSSLYNLILQFSLYRSVLIDLAFSRSS